jgi:hypothetical protein
MLLLGSSRGAAGRMCRSMTHHLPLYMRSYRSVLAPDHPAAPRGQHLQLSCVVRNFTSSGNVGAAAGSGSEDTSTSTTQVPNSASSKHTPDTSVAAALRRLDVLEQQIAALQDRVQSAAPGSGPAAAGTAHGGPASQPDPDDAPLQGAGQPPGLQQQYSKKATGQQQQQQQQQGPGGRAASAAKVTPHQAQGRKPNAGEKVAEDTKGTAVELHRNLVSTGHGQGVPDQEGHAFCSVLSAFWVGWVSTAWSTRRCAAAPGHKHAHGLASFAGWLESEGCLQNVPTPWCDSQPQLTAPSLLPLCCPLPPINHPPPHTDRLPGQPLHGVPALPAPEAHAAGGPQAASTC